MAAPAGCRAVVESLPDIAAMLDSDGDIVAVNSAWTAFGRANGQPPDYDPVGENYLAVTRGAEEPSARQTAVALAGVLEGVSPGCSVEYPCHGPDRARWFQLHASGGVTGGDHVLVVHRNVTARRLAAAVPGRYRQQLVSRLVDGDAVASPAETLGTIGDDTGDRPANVPSADAGGSYLVRYTRGDEQLVTALVEVFGALDVDVEGRETVLGDWIDPGLLTALDERDDPFTFTSRVWEFEVRITDEAVTVYPREADG